LHGLEEERKGRLEIRATYFAVLDLGPVCGLDLLELGFALAASLRRSLRRVRGVKGRGFVIV